MPGFLGRWVRLSPARRFIADLMHISRQVPTVIAERRLRLGDIIQARAACARRPSWTAIFIKAFGLVAARHAPLRRVYMPWPCAHLYQHHDNIVSFSVERQDHDEPIVAIAQRARPELLTLAELDAFVRQCRDQPLDHFGTYRRARRMAWLPGLVRRFLADVMLRLSGKVRVRTLGTFALTTPAAHGAGMVQVLTPAASTLHYGLFEPDGSLEMRLTFDHRVYDGAFAARVLVELEQTLLGDLLNELRGMGEGKWAA